jgi:hypothetical protein
VCSSDLLIKEAKSQKSAFSTVTQFITKTASNENDFLFRVASYHRAVGLDMDPKLYRVASKNPIDSHKEPGTYLKACQASLQRSLTREEAEFLIRVGHLLRQYHRSRTLPSES